MRINGKIIAALLALILLTQVFVTPLSVLAKESVTFEDVKETDYFYNAVMWAAKEGVTSGVSPTSFAPNGKCTRGQIVTFLWRAAGEPETSSQNRFTDIKESDYFYKAVLWAVERGITKGTTDTSFSPNATCTRGQAVTFLYRYSSSPEVSSTKNPFSDVKSSDFYYNAVLWAVENDITAGLSQTKFGPDSSCTRGQIVTFLWRMFFSGNQPWNNYPCTDQAGHKITYHEGKEAGLDYPGWNAYYSCEKCGFTTKETIPQTLAPINETVSVDRMDVDLNKILTGGYETKAFASEVFNEIKDKLLIFKASSSCDYYYRAGVKTPLYVPVSFDSNGVFMSMRDFADIIGGTFTQDTIRDATVTYGDYSFVCKGVKGELIYKDTSTTLNIKTSRKLENEKYTFIQSIDITQLFGITSLDIYVTDTHLVLISCGKIFEDYNGNYIPYEGEKLFMSEEDAEEFSKNMFVDIPNIITHGTDNVTTYTYPSLDLNINVETYAIQGVEASVPLAPSIIVGQGEDSSNQTIVRVFDNYQTLHTQFCAYPASVTGGVQVAAAKTDDSVNILTAPYKDSNINVLKVYDANGAYKFSVIPSGSAPYSIASGKFLSASETCFAVASMYDNGKKLEFFSSKDGRLIKGVDLGLSSDKKMTITTNRSGGELDNVVINIYESPISVYEYSQNNISNILSIDKNINGLFTSAFGGYLISYDSTDEYGAFSYVTEYKDGNERAINVGERENLFFSTLAKESEDKYVRKGTFWHDRLDFSAKAVQSVKTDGINALHTNDLSRYEAALSDSVLESYDTKYNMWEACTTHRWVGKSGYTTDIISYKDPASGLNAYAALRQDNKSGEYYEMSSAYKTVTYAPNISALDKINYWTKRSYYSQLVKLYREAPENTVAVSPVHEHEIVTDSASVGDYNPYMVAGFADWLKNLYGTIENVNERFGTPFKSFAELDPPRNDGRGNWDMYSTSDIENDYFSVWIVYNRNIVSRNIIQSYRETILAGFPAELIKAHQIPEAHEVNSMLGYQNTRITPADVALACGTGYGGTRYGVWFSTNPYSLSDAYLNPYSFFKLASGMGQRNITLGEHNTLSSNKTVVYNQLRYMFNNGLVFLHTLEWVTQIADKELAKTYDDTERYAIDKLQSENIPRSASSGGTGNICAYVNGDIKYNIVEIGTGEDNPGLLKSVNEDGSFEGTVYLQPFHAAVKAVDLERGLEMYGTGKQLVKITGRKDAVGTSLSGINYGDMIDIRINAKESEGKSGTITVQITEDGSEIPCVTYTFDLDGEGKEYRYLFKNQNELKNPSILVIYKDVEITSFDATLMYEMDARSYYQEINPVAHKGGVSFDILNSSRSYNIQTKQGTV